MFITTIGCKRVLGDGHIDINGGLFGVLEEKLRRVVTGSIIPAKANASCKCRLTSVCNIDCVHAVHCIISGGNVSYRNLNAKM